MAKILYHAVPGDWRKEQKYAFLEKAGSVAGVKWQKLDPDDRGNWIWLDVSPARKPMLAKVLWTLGFHWNQRRGVWQHPCGSFDPLGSHPTDPRTKYRSYFPADMQPA